MAVYSDIAREKIEDYWAMMVEQKIQQYLVQELKSSFKISTYDNGQEALTGILKDIPDIVLSDVIKE